MTRKFRRYITVDKYTRKGYKRKGYIRADGTKVKGCFVPPTKVKAHKARVWKLGDKKRK